MTSTNTEMRDDPFPVPGGRHDVSTSPPKTAGLRFADPAGDACSRVDTLRALADCEPVMTDTAFAFPDAAERDEDGFNLGQSTGMSALLLEVVADTEVTAHQLHTAKTRPLSRRWTNLDDDPTVAQALERLSTETELAARAELTMALYHAVVGRVGNQAAEALAVTACRYYELTGLSMQDAMARVGYPSEDGDTRHDHASEH